MVKRLLAMQETWVRSLSQEDSLEEETAIHFSVLAGIFSVRWMEEPGGLQSMESQRVSRDKVSTHVRTCTHTQTHRHSDTHNSPRLNTGKVHLLFIS